MQSQPKRITDQELHALVDGQLSASERDALLTRLAPDAQAQDKYRLWCRQRERVQAVHAEVMAQAIPPALLAAAERLAKQGRQRDGWWRLGGMAASVVLAFGAGWLVRGDWPKQGASAQLARAMPQGDFVRQARYAYAVYSPEVLHPVEVAADQQKHLVQWLSKRLGRSIKVPDLSALGYELVGGRLLPGELGARAQFMFQSSAGVRVTLYLGAVGEGSNGVDRRETAFQFSADRALASFYWIDQGFGYAMTGTLPKAELLQIATAVYQQL